jgi:light-regulated signal transduction histidine kinase (bacteriophytochrome)
LVQSLDAGADDYVNKSQDMEVIVAHTTALARRMARTRQIQSMNEQAVRKQLELREAEIKRQQAEERARLADELERANQALAESNEQLQQFAHVASHDLQAPLRRVILLCGLLRDNAKDKLDKESAESIQYVIKSANGMQRLINDLLSYSRVDTDDQPLEPTDCAAVLNEVLTNFEETLEETSAGITYDRLPTVPAYRTQLVQLFQNLIANAINYRSDEPPRIHVAAEARENHWRFSVRDNGIGIAPEHCEQVFGMFRRLHGSERSGTGIGLATCKKIVECHGGRIWVESEPGRGSTFYFTISRSAPMRFHR